MNLETHEDAERVKKIRVKSFEHVEAGVKMRLKEMTLYLLNEDDFGINPEDFRPSVHEHSIPKYEMARIYLIVCAETGDHLGFSPDDRDDPVYQMYERAYQRLIHTEEDAELLKRVREIGEECGFRDEGHHAVPQLPH